MAGLEILLQDLQLSKDQLDAEVRKEHLSELSRIIDDHETLGPELGLTPDEMTAIGSEQLQTLAVFRAVPSGGAGGGSCPPKLRHNTRKRSPSLAVKISRVR